MANFGMFHWGIKLRINNLISEECDDFQEKFQILQPTCNLNYQSIYYLYLLTNIIRVQGELLCGQFGVGRTIFHENIPMWPHFHQDLLLQQTFLRNNI